MPRTKKRRDPVTRQEILQELVRVRFSLEVLAEAEEALSDGEFLAVEFKPSLKRGADSLETFAGALRQSLAMFKAGSPIAVDLDTTAVKDAVAKRKAKTAKKGAGSPPKVSKRKNGRAQ